MLRDSLEPFEKATTMLSSQYPTQSMAYFALEVLKIGVQKSSYPSYYHTLANKSLQFQCQYYLVEFIPDEQKDCMKVSKTISNFVKYICLKKNIYLNFSQLLASFED